MSNFIRITPFMMVDNIERALQFFTSILGFQIGFRAGTYAYVFRETAAFRVLEQTGPEGAPPGNRRFAYYIDVMTSTPYTPNSSRDSTLCPSATSTGLRTKSTASGNCWCWRQMGI